MLPDKPPSSPGASPRVRLFFALWPTPEAAAALTAIAGDVATSLGGRVTRPDTVHLTLLFLGEVDSGSLKRIEAAASRIAVPPFRLELDRLELWARQRLIVARCDCPPALADLAAQLRASLAEDGLVANHPDYPFKPHVTLVRKLPFDGGSGAQAGTPDASPRGEMRPAACLPKLGPQAWDCDRFVLARSRLSPGGSGYEIVAEFSLKG